jgi:hypothetical protein
MLLRLFVTSRPSNELTKVVLSERNTPISVRFRKSFGPRDGMILASNPQHNKVFHAELHEVTNLGLTIGMT